MTGLRGTAPALLAALLGCVAAVSSSRAAEEPPTKVRETRLESSKRTSATMRLASYDRDTGLCSAGAMQLLTQAQIAERKAAWSQHAADSGCIEPAKRPVRARALYPVDDRGRSVKGAAHLLLELDETGAIASVHAVCATSEAFARAAAATAAKLAFSPRTCGGQPLRSVILLPLAFDP